MTEQRWRGHTHKELYLLLDDGPGPAASADPARRWGAVSAALTEVGEDLHAALTRASAAWTGHAAGNAYDRLSTTAGWAAHTATSAAEMQTAVENQAGHIATARAEMPKPEDVPAVQPDPALAPAVQVIAVQADLEPAEATAASGEERAFEVMAAYELNSDTTTAALASFDTPAGLTEVTTVQERSGTLPTTAASAPGLGVGHHGTGGPGHAPDHGRGWHSPATSGAAATAGAAAPVHAEVSHRPLPPPPPAPAPAPGNLSVAAPTPFFSPNTGRAARQSRSADRAAAGTPRPGATSFSAQVNDLQAAAAGQAAVNHAAHPAAAPVAASPAQGQDKMAMRRFGLDAIGSSQWFGEEPAVGQSPRRRRDFREQQEEVTESVDVLGEQHKLPPTVIGDGPR